MIFPLFLAAVLFDVLGLTMGGWLLFRAIRGASGIPLRDCGILLSLGLALAILAVGIGGIAGGVFFTLRLMVHALACVLAPLMIVRGIWHLRHRNARPEGRAPRFGIALLSAGLIVELVYVYAKEIEPYWLEVTHYEYRVSRRAGLKEPIKVIVLADLQTDHIGDYEREVFATMDELRADLILLPGDYLQITEAAGGGADDIARERQALVDLFNGLRHEPRYGIWGVDGDVDSARGTFEGSVAKPLSDETRVLPGTPPLKIIGLSRPASRRPLTPDQQRSIAAYPGLTIVMGHAPDFVAGAIRADAEYGPEANPTPMLCIAGHTHGGQVVVPLFGPPITLTSIPRRFAAGMHEFGEMTLFVSRGVGLERGLAPRIRFNCRPELAVITLK